MQCPGLLYVVRPNYRQTNDVVAQALIKAGIIFLSMQAPSVRHLHMAGPQPIETRANSSILGK
jgi:hypothetical protein